MYDLVNKRIKESIEVKTILLQDETYAQKISLLADDIVATLKNGGKLILFGNGGSASDALHFAGEMVGRFKKERQSYPAIVLNADVATITAIANDYGYDDVFARQIEGFGSTKDLAIGISTSGNSENVYRALTYAKENGLNTASLLGKDGGKIADITKHTIVVPYNDTARVQECHICIIHILCELVEELMGNE